MTTPADSPADFLVLGDAPRPTTGDALNRMLRLVVQRAAAQTTEIAGLDSISIESALDGPNITSLDLDLTGLRVSINGTDAAPLSEEQLGQVVSREEGVIREFRIRANPLTFQDVDVVLDGSVESVKFVWAVDDRARLGMGESDEPLGRLRIQLSAETDQQALVTAATELLQQQVAEAGVTVSDLEVELQSVGPRSATMRANAKVRKGILGASAAFEANASIDNNMVLRITEPQLSSRNPVVAALLFAIRDRITAAVASPIDLNESLPPWLHLRDVTLDLGERIRVELSFG